jgi:hypothetical protein
MRLVPQRLGLARAREGKRFMTDAERAALLPEQCDRIAVLAMACERAVRGMPPGWQELLLDVHRTLMSELMAWEGMLLEAGP